MGINAYGDSYNLHSASEGNVIEAVESERVCLRTYRDIMYIYITNDERNGKAAQVLIKKIYERQEH